MKLQEAHDQLSKLLPEIERSLKQTTVPRYRRRLTDARITLPLLMELCTKYQGTPYDLDYRWQRLGDRPLRAIFRLMEWKIKRMGR